MKLLTIGLDLVVDEAAEEEEEDSTTLPVLITGTVADEVVDLVADEAEEAEDEAVEDEEVEVLSELHHHRLTVVPVETGGKFKKEEKIGLKEKLQGARARFGG